MIQKLIDAYELEREMHHKCIDTDEEIEKSRAKWDSGLWIRYKVFEDAIILAPRVDPIKHGHWIEEPIEDEWGKLPSIWHCSECDNLELNNSPYCPNCGAKMDKDEWEEPEINPCRGCVDYDGRGGCKSNGGCGADMREVEDGKID